MKTHKRSTKQSLITLVLGGVVLLVGAIIFFIAPTIRKVKNDYTAFHTEKEEIERLFTEGSTEGLLKQQVEDLSDDLIELNVGFIRKGMEVEFISFLEVLGASYDLKQTIQLNEPGVHPKTDFFPFASMTLKLEGTFAGALRYLTELERSPYYINITSLTITSAKDGKSLLSVMINGEVFWQHEQQE